MKPLAPLCLVAALLTGCGNIAAVKSFNTPFASPSSGDTARLRVMANGMVRAVPEKDCVDWYSPGAGVIVSPKKGFADRNNENLGMPAGAEAFGVVSEVLIPAGKPFTLSFLDGGSGGYGYTRNCVGMFHFVPQKGGDYELVAKGYSACGVELKRLDGAAPAPVKPTKAEYCSALANF